MVQLRRERGLVDCVRCGDRERFSGRFIGGQFGHLVCDSEGKRISPIGCRKQFGHWCAMVVNSVEKETVKGFCPHCDGPRSSATEAQVTETWNDDDLPIWQTTTYRILRCLGCRTVYYQKVVVFSEYEEFIEHPITGEVERVYPEDITTWPTPTKRAQPNWLNSLSKRDATLAELLSDTYVALENDLLILAAIGCRTAFDRATMYLDIDPAITFGEKLDELEKLRLIGSSERAILAVLTEAGNAAAHRGWKPEFDDVVMIITLIESFIFRACIGAAAVEQLAAKVPPRGKRRVPDLTAPEPAAESQPKPQA